MKSAIVLKQTKKCILLFSCGTTLSLAAFLMYTLNPIKMIIDWQLRMSPNSMRFGLWKKPPIDVYIKVYLFNISNPEEFLSGRAKLKVEEIGPYCFKEILEHTKVRWYENGTMSYVPKRTVLFVPEISVGDPLTDRIMAPNIPLLGVSSALHKAGYLVNYPIIQLANFLDSKPILNITINEYFWGYEDALVRLASGIVPNFINFKKFGLLDRMYDEGENTMLMNVKYNSDMKEEVGRYLSIEKLNGNPGLSNWGYVQEKNNKTNPENTNCNRLQGATEGVVFPTRLDKDADFRIFRKAFCRTFPIAFVKEVEMNGLPGFLYTIAPDWAETPDINPNNECYCRKMTRCLRKGLSDLTPCYYNIPAAVSLPHFLDADPALLEDIEGLRPDHQKHGSFVILQPDVGIPVKINSRIQTNLVMHKAHYSSRIAAFNGLTIPLFWTEVWVPSLPTHLMMMIKMSVQILPTINIILILFLAIFGILTIACSFVNAVMLIEKQQHQHELDEIQRRDSADIRIPLGYGQFTSIKILPSAIKTITSKTDLFS